MRPRPSAVETDVTVGAMLRVAVARSMFGFYSIAVAVEDASPQSYNMYNMYM